MWRPPRHRRDANRHAVSSDVMEPSGRRVRTVPRVPLMLRNVRNIGSSGRRAEEHLTVDWQSPAAVVALAVGRLDWPAVLVDELVDDVPSGAAWHFAPSVLCRETSGEIPLAHPRATRLAERSEHDALIGGCVWLDGLDARLGWRMRLNIESTIDVVSESLVARADVAAVGLVDEAHA